MSKKHRLILIAGIILFIAAMALYPTIKRTFFTDSQTDQPLAASSPGSSRTTLPVEGLVLHTKDLEENFVVTGFLIPDEEVELSFETSGQITNIYFQEGTQIKKGQLLAKVNDNTLQAELKKLETQLPLAEDRLFRQQSLLEKDAVSQESFETVSTELETLRADIQLVKARIEQTELRAPFDGVIGLRRVSEGTYASPTTVIASLTKISPLKIEFSVNEKQVNLIKPGKAIEFSVDNDLNTYPASVYAVESRLDPTTLTLTARARYANPGGRIKPGQSAKVEIHTQTYENTLVIPSVALIAEMGRDIVYVYNNGTARQAEVVKGMRTATSIQIIDGLVVGDTILTTGVMQLRDGMPVTLSHIRTE